MATSLLQNISQEESTKLTNFLFGNSWKTIPQIDKKLLWKRMCEDKLFDSLEISGINKICQTIYEHNLNEGLISELKCFSHIQNNDISLFFVKYGSQYGNSWFSHRDEEIMNRIGGGWEAPFILVFLENQLINIHHLPEEIRDLTVHELCDGTSYFSGKFCYFENIWIFNRNGEKIGESEKFIPIKNQLYFSVSKYQSKPNVLQKIVHNNVTILSSIPITWIDE